MVLVLMLRIRAQVTKLHNKIHNDLREMQKIDWTLAHELAAAAENDQAKPRLGWGTYDQAEPTRTTTHHSPTNNGLTPCCGRTPIRTATYRPDNNPP